MAQWLGQYTGNTHATRVEDAKATLRQAVAAFRSAASAEEHGKKAKAVARLARGLLRARCKDVSARISAAREVQAEEVAASLRGRLAAIHEGGMGAILAEFGASDAAGSRQDSIGDLTP